MSDRSTVGRIEVGVSDGIAAVEIHNPAQRNALTRGMCLELQQLMPALDADPRVAVVTLRGSGSIFSAGASLHDLPSVLLDPQHDGTRVDQLSRADDAITSIAKPTVALVDGACLGGGWQLASACDFIIASDRSVFGITPAKLGVIYPRPGIERLVRQVGPANAKFILITGQTFSAVQARDFGLVAEVVAESDFVTRCDVVLADIIGNSRFSQHTLKALVDLTAASAPHIDAAWQQAWAAMTSGPDMTIGVGAFLNRTRPRFTWEPAGVDVPPHHVKPPTPVEGARHER